MKYFLTITKLSTGAQFIRDLENVTKLSEAQKIAQEYMDNQDVEEVVIHLTEKFLPKNHQNDVVERMSKGAKSLNRLFGMR